MCVPTGKSTGISTVPSSLIVPFTSVPSGNVIITVAFIRGSPVSASAKFTTTELFPNVIFPGVAAISAVLPTTSTSRVLLLSV